MAGTAQPMGQTQIPTSPLATQTKGNYRPPINTLGQRVGGIQPATPGALPIGLPNLPRWTQKEIDSANFGRSSLIDHTGNPVPDSLVGRPKVGDLKSNMPTMPSFGQAGINNNMPLINTKSDMSWKGAPAPGLVGGTIASWDGYAQDPTFKGYWDSEFYTPNRNNSWQGNETPWSGYYDNMEVSGGSPTERAFFHQYLDSIGRSDLYAKPDVVTPNPGQTWKEGDGLGHFSADVSMPGQTTLETGGMLPMPGGGDLIQPRTGAIYGGTINPKTGRMFPPGEDPHDPTGRLRNKPLPPLPPGGTPNMPEGFTQGAGGRVITPWTNSKTGETWNAPSQGYRPPNSDWQQGGQKIKFPPGQGGQLVAAPATTPRQIPTQPTAGAQQPANINTLAAEGIKGAGYATGQGLDFTPSDVSADNIYSSTVAPGTVSSGSYTPGMVTPNQLATTGLDPYMNPYTQQVIEANEADILRGADMGLDALGAQAQAAKAFGGSRHGIAMGEMGGKVAEQLARSSAGLRQANFAQAQQAAQQDIGTNLQGQLANQGAGLQAGLANVGTGLQANLANQQTGLQSSLANQANLYNTGLANQSANLQAALANQGAGMQGQGMRLDAANQLANISNLGFGMGQQVSQNLAAQGAMQQALQQAVMEAAKQKYGQYTGHPALGLQYLNNALGITPYGETTTKSKQPGLFDYLTLATTAYTGMPS